MKLEYNGIDLKVVRLVSCERTTELDPAGVDYLWTVVRLEVESVWTPPEGTMPTELVVTAGGAQPNSAPVTVADGFNQQIRNSPPRTDQWLRHHLLQPRRPLKVAFESAIADTGGGVPEPSEQVWYSIQYGDAANGPVPVACNITESLGNARAWVVRYVIEFRANECGNGRAANEVAAVLSNRFTMTLSYDEQYLATRTISGTAIFRADALRSLGRKPDDFRLELVPPVPANCKRQIVALVASPDGYSYQYEVADVEQATTYLDRPHDGNQQPVAGADARLVAYVDVIDDQQFVFEFNPTTVGRHIVSDLLQASWLREQRQRDDDDHRKGVRLSRGQRQIGP